MYYTENKINNVGNIRKLKHKGHIKVFGGLSCRCSGDGEG